eukprot:CFRG4007T1
MSLSRISNHQYHEDRKIVLSVLQDTNEEAIADLHNMKAENLISQVPLIFERVREIGGSSSYGSSIALCSCVESTLNALAIGSAPSRIPAVRDSHASLYAESLRAWKDHNFYAPNGHEQTPHGEITMNLIQSFASCDNLMALQTIAPALELYVGKPSYEIQTIVSHILLKMVIQFPNELSDEVSNIVAAGLDSDIVPVTPQPLLDILPQIYDVVPGVVEANLSRFFAPYKATGTKKRDCEAILRILLKVATNKAYLILPYVGAIRDSIYIPEKGPQHAAEIIALFKKIVFEDTIFVMESLPDLEGLAGTDEYLVSAVHNLRLSLGIEDSTDDSECM